MFGALAFLPLFLQVVRGVSPTISGVYLLPMVLGLLLTSIGSGQLISRFGRYKVFPIVGHGAADRRPATCCLASVRDAPRPLVMDVLLLPARAQPRTDPAGAGHRRAELGRLRRSWRRDVGRHVLPLDRRIVRRGHLRHRSSPAGWPADLGGALAGVRLPPGFNVGGGAVQPGRCSTGCPRAIHADVLHAYAQAIDRVFLLAVPVAAAAFVLSWFLREVPLRRYRRCRRHRRGPRRGVGAALVGRGARAGAAPAGRRRPAQARLREDGRAVPASACPAAAAGCWPGWPRRGPVAGDGPGPEAGVSVEHGRPYVDTLVDAGVRAAR